MDDLDVSNEYLSVNAPLSDVDFNAEMAALESTPYDDSGDTPPVHLDLPEVTVTTIVSAVSSSLLTALEVSSI